MTRPSGGTAVDDALLVANLVYIGTLVIGGVLFAFFSMAFVITLFLAGTGQGIASLVGLVVRPLQRFRRPRSEQSTTAAAPVSADYVRAAVVAKAEAILASQRAASAAAGSREAESSPEQLRPEPEDVPAPAARPAALPAAAQRLAITGKAAAAVVRPHTGTQPILIGKAS